MTKQNQQIILFTILALLSYGVWKYFFDREKIIKDKPFTKGYSIEEVELKITDDLGELTAKFTSPNLTRFTDSPILHINQPILWTYKQGKQQWLLKSSKAEYNTDTDEVNFPKKMMAETTENDLPTSFAANSLLLNLDSKKAISNDGVTFKQNNLIMTGQIAKIDLTNEILEVNKNVKAIYTPINKH